MFVYEDTDSKYVAKMPFEKLSNMDMLHLFASAIDDDDEDYIQIVQEEIYMRMEG